MVLRVYTVRYLALGGVILCLFLAAVAVAVADRLERLMRRRAIRSSLTDSFRPLRT